MIARHFPPKALITFYFFTIVIFVAFILYAKYLLNWNILEVGRYILFGTLALIMVLPIIISNGFPATIITIYFFTIVVFIASIFCAKYFLYWNIFEVGKYILFGTLALMMILPIIIKKIFLDMSKFWQPFWVTFLFSCFLNVISFSLFFYEIGGRRYYVILPLLALCVTPLFLPVFITQYRNLKSIFSISIGFIVGAVIIFGSATFFVFASMPAVRY